MEWRRFGVGVGVDVGVGVGAGGVADATGGEADVEPPPPPQAAPNPTMASAERHAIAARPILTSTTLRLARQDRRRYDDVRLTVLLCESAYVIVHEPALVAVIVKVAGAAADAGETVRSRRRCSSARSFPYSRSRSRVSVACSDDPAPLNESDDGVTMIWCRHLAQTDRPRARPPRPGRSS